MSVENSENSSECRVTSSRDSDYEDGGEKAEYDYGFRNSESFTGHHYELQDDDDNVEKATEEGEEEQNDAARLEDALGHEVDYEDKEEDSVTEKQRPTRDARRRKTIYELDSYSTLTPGSRDTDIREEEDAKTAPLARFSKSLGIPGVARVNLSSLTQKILGCVVDENVTTEYPWIYVRKEVIEDNIELHSESSDFLAIKDELQQYPDSRLLLGYAPAAATSLHQAGEGEFYVCLTDESREAVARRIEALRQEQQQRVRNAVLKEPRSWQDLGSAAAVDQQSLKKSRPLFEIEVESTVHKLKAPSSLIDRGSGEQRDGYVEILPARENFDNVTRLFVDKACTATPASAEGSAQTEMPMQVNSWCQSSPDRETLPAESAPSRAKKLQSFVESRAEQVFKETEANATWDVYANDYAKLAAAAPSAMSEPLGELRYEEQQSYYEGKLCGGRVISDLAWHPQWTGLFAAAYTRAARSENLVGPKPLHQDRPGPNHVLVWSFDDCLRPKLVLESERQVTSVSFCPRDGNILIGGCENGQIVVWDTTGRIEELERVSVQTAAEAKYASVVKSLGTWMRETLDPAVVRPTATSSLQYSQKGAITKIEWLSAHSKLDDRGRLRELPADTAEADLSLQFVASSEDGSIAFWDLSWRPPAEKQAESRSRKRKTAEKPQSLVQSISPYKILDGAFKPLYILIVQRASQTRNAVVTTMSLRRADLRKVQLEPRPRDDDPVTKRRHFKVLLEKEVEERRPAGIFVGTASGECGLVSWEGYEFSTGISLNKEICKWTWRKRLHDGPVSHAVRSRHLKDVLLTVGGRIFAVWREDAEEPVLWRKSESRYTACCWDGSKPTVIILGRNDGSVEIWDVFNKSHEPNITQSLSGRIITGIYAHELPLNPACVGFCDYNGALRTFLAPKVLFPFSGESDVKWMRQFVDREVNRIKDFNTWQKNWNEMNAGDHSEEKARAPEREDVNKLPEADSRAKLDYAAKSATAKRRKQLIEEMQARWVRREVERMQTAVLEKKGLRGEELERRREPLLRLKREARDKEARRQAVIGRTAELFEDALLSNFPSQQGQKLLTAAAAAVSKSTKKPSATGDLISLHTPDTGDVGETADEKVIGEYAKIEAEALSRMRRRSHELAFSWRKLINEGLQRRRSMDVNLKMHKIKVNGDEEEKEEEGEGEDERAESRGQQSDAISSSLESFEDPRRDSRR